MLIEFRMLIVFKLMVVLIIVLFISLLIIGYMIYTSASVFPMRM